MGERVRRDRRIEIHQQPAPIGAGALQHRANLALRQSREQNIFRSQIDQIAVDIIYPQQALRHALGKLIVNVTIKPLREKARVIAAEAPADAPQRIAERAVLQRRQRRNDLPPERKRQRGIPLRAMLPVRQLVRKVERKQDADTVRAFRLISAPHILRLAACRPAPPARQGKTARRAAAPARRQPARSCFHSRCKARSAARAARRAFPATASLRRPSGGASAHSSSSPTLPVRAKRSIARPSRSAMRSAQPPAQPLYSRTSAASSSSSPRCSPHAPLKW